MLTFTTATFTSYNLVINLKPSKTGLELNYITELTREKDIILVPVCKKQWMHDSSNVTIEMGSERIQISFKVIPVVESHYVTVVLLLVSLS